MPAETESPVTVPAPGVNPNAPAFVPSPSTVLTSTAVHIKSSTLLMTCRVSVSAPDGTHVEARALLNNGSSASFISERLVQTLQLPRNH